jgi:hypothetical protein
MEQYHFRGEWGRAGRNDQNFPNRPRDFRSAARWALPADRADTYMGGKPEIGRC